ncbi:MAG: hypothetical protein DMD26_16985 [Gemmatimonadetes bacterium]|nr:MAG: hypothetical protein DMD26_16985 [Gemmatimonadota bacterium]
MHNGFDDVTLYGAGYLDPIGHWPFLRFLIGGEFIQTRIDHCIQHLAVALFLGRTRRERPRFGDKRACSYDCLFACLPIRQQFGREGARRAGEGHEPRPMLKERCRPRNLLRGSVLRGIRRLSECPLPYTLAQEVM